MIKNFKVTIFNSLINLLQITVYWASSMQSTPASSSARKMTSAAFSGFVKDVHDLYVTAVRNGYYIQKESSSAVNEIMVY